MTGDRPWLWLGRNALWIVVPLIPLLVFARGTTSESGYSLLWLGPFVGLGVVWVKYLLWRERRYETPAERASREAAKELERWRAPGQRVPNWVASVLVVLLSLGQFVLVVGIVYVVLHFVVKFW